MITNEILMIRYYIPKCRRLEFNVDQIISKRRAWNLRHKIAIAMMFSLNSPYKQLIPMFVSDKCYQGTRMREDIKVRMCII